MASPTAIFTAHRRRNKTEAADKGGVKNKEMRHKDVQSRMEQKDKKMTKGAKADKTAQFRSYPC